MPIETSIPELHTPSIARITLTNVNIKRVFRPLSLPRYRIRLASGIPTHLLIRMRALCAAREIALPEYMQHRSPQGLAQEL